MYLPRKKLFAGWIPVLTLLIYTFASNILGGQGRIIAQSGPLFITDQALASACIRTARFFYMVTGVKIIISTVSPDELIVGLRTLCRPLDIVGIRLHDFFHVLGLTIQCFPLLQRKIAAQHLEARRNTEIRGFWGRARMITALLVPLIRESMNHPEEFFEQADGRTAPI